MTRRFNFTGRERLTSEEFFAKTISENPLIASLSLNLRNTPLAPAGAVYIEAYSGTVAQRFDCGTVSDLRVPPKVNLSAIETGGSVLFRVKVVNPENGLILASGDRLRLVGEGEDPKRRPLLAVKTVDYLDEEIWKVEVSLNDPPVLLLNKKVPNFKDLLVEDPLIGGAILVPALREILSVLLDDMEGGEWQQDWTKFVKAVHPDADIDTQLDPEEKFEQIDGIVAVFAETHGFARKCVSQNGGAD